VAGAIATLDAPGEQDRVLSFPAAQMDRVLQHRADGEAARAARQAYGQFRRRWGHGPAADAGPVVADPGPRALVIDDTMPGAGSNAEALSIRSHISALQRLGYAVSFVAARDMSPGGDAVAALERDGVACCGLPAYATVEELLRRQAGCFDLIYLRRLSNAAKYMALARQYFPRARLLYAAVDLRHLRLARQIGASGQDALPAQNRRLYLAESMAACSADAVLTRSTHDAALLLQAVPGVDVHVVPGVVATEDAACVAAALRAAIENRRAPARKIHSG
jgi:hypothetical protein